MATVAAFSKLVPSIASVGSSQASFISTYDYPRLIGVVDRVSIELDTQQVDIDVPHMLIILDSVG